jgi:hypothetical protein
LPRLSPRLEEIARTGRFDRRQYDSPSAARQAIVAGAAACGWQLDDLTARISSGQWPGFAAFYTRYRTEAQRTKALLADWENAALYLAERSCGRDGHTRERTHRRGATLVVESVPVEVRSSIQQTAFATKDRLAPTAGTGALAATDRPVVIAG